MKVLCATHGYSGLIGCSGMQMIIFSTTIRISSFVDVDLSDCIQYGCEAHVDYLAVLAPHFRSHGKAILYGNASSARYHNLSDLGSGLCFNL